MAEALRLADELDDIHTTHVARNAAAELRRLHVENKLLAGAADILRVAWRDEVHNLMKDKDQLQAQRDALLEALRRLESALDWHLGRSSFTQTMQLKGLEHSANVRKELFAAHDAARAAIAAVEGEKNHG